MEIFINVRPYQTRVACVKQGHLKQIFYHRSQTPSLVGALYKGRVAKIVRRLNYAFVDLGLEKTGFLYGKDLPGKTKELAKALRPGQEVLAQIKADPLRSKGVRLSLEVALAGLYLVYLPEQNSKRTISRQINSSVERQRLSEMTEDFKAPGALIVRTFAQNREKKELEKDLKTLKQQWKEIQSQFKQQKTLGPIHQGEDPLLIFLRDSLSLGGERFVVDEKQTFKKVTKWLKAFRPDLAKKAEYYQGELSLFENFKLESQAKKSLEKKVPLKSGGFLIFEELEAFSVIDVNSGRFFGGKNLSQSLLQLNLEAAQVIAEQVQLRQWGGIILVDFIDMESPEDGEKVVACLEKGFKGDKSHPRVFPMGDLGLVQITRKRSKNSLSYFMTENCPSCRGWGRKKTLPTLATDLFLKLESLAPSSPRFLRKKQSLKVTCHPEIKHHIEQKEQNSLEFFEKKLSCRLLLEDNPKLSLENFRIEKL